MRIVLASNNQGKLHELKALFAPLGVEIIPQRQLMQGEAPEPFCTFVENALSKARFAAEHTGLPAIADDAGLCVDAFGGEPGVQTAFYCTRFGYPKSDANNVQALLEQLQGETNRQACMVSTLVGVRHPHDPEPLIAVGKVRVQIATERRGHNGFGFDPVLLVPELGQTFAELPEQVKNQYSHRGRSSRAMLEQVRQYWLDGTRPDAG
ncbi:RdgB/HAM1 family non-canonical purine NTP pyrophosphatase [Corticibacter populi]|uniref:dITP/XTP pyrophosphatase n=1 Tax=Corticibacter populi TaxID=1550736 RepID=A0A3M6R0H6_9BURK|nr:RdgB/HAM1 family non-canonical purine NTP pyrophosphatase [Corticibacter populi]RMX08312.1 RdgB/HAM1 family non-canonical purine NTP pyrophosphatase [Corticibacter populi]RZS35597.1 XTP/dITP diphosphohydrolase [Corticibacter populi]